MIQVDENAAQLMGLRAASWYCIQKEVERSGRRTMWCVGICLTIVAVSWMAAGLVR